MSEDGKTRYIIEIKYLDNQNRTEISKDIEEIDITTDDIEWSMEQYKRNRPPFEWRIKHDYGKGL